MSVQSEFFDTLLQELMAKGVSASVAEENVTKFRDQLKSRAQSEEQLDSALSKIPPASIAENIYNMIRQNEGDGDVGAKSEVMVIDTESDTVETTVREGHDAVAPLAKENETESEEGTHSEHENAEHESAEATEAVTEEQETEAVETVEETTPDSETVIFAGKKREKRTDPKSRSADDSEKKRLEAEQKNSAHQKAEQSALEEITFDEDDDELSKYSPGAKRRVHSISQTPPGERKTVRRAGETVDLFMDDGETKTNWLFILMALVLVPLGIVLGAAIFVIFIGFWLALAVVITVLLVGLVALVAAGSALSLAGLIFGVIESISGNGAAGLFEIGLALIIGGVVMFVSIWLYNFAVRFIPFIIRKLGVLLVKIFALFKKSLRKIKELTSKI